MKNEEVEPLFCVKLKLEQWKSMSQLNIEIKARSNNQNFVREILRSRGAKFKGVDHQIDTYFKTNYGRLKLREGNIENSLIHYDREDKDGPKPSNVSFYKSADKSSLKEILTKALGILVVVDKSREIHFVENVKFHIDSVKELGSFLEIEAIDPNGKIGKEKLLEQCNFYLDLFKIRKEDLVAKSYSDLLLEKINRNLH